MQTTTEAVQLNRYLFWSEEDGYEGYTFIIKANTNEEAYSEAYDTHGPQVENMLYMLMN